MDITTTPLRPSSLFPKLYYFQASINNGYIYYGFCANEIEHLSMRVAAFECIERFISHKSFVKYERKEPEFQCDYIYHPDVQPKKIFCTKYVQASTGRHGYLPEALTSICGRTISVNLVSSHGLAIHQSLGDAVRHGMYEWIERDAFFRFWYWGSTEGDALLDDTCIAGLFRSDGEHRLSLWRLDTVKHLHVVAAVLQGRDGFMVGLAAGEGIEATAHKAVREVALFHAYWQTYLAGLSTPARFASFNDHLSHFWLKGGRFEDWIRFRTPERPRPKPLDIDRLFYRVLWMGTVQTESVVVVRTVMPGAMPQHSPCFGPIRAGDQLAQALPPSLRKPSGVHPFA